MKAGVVTSSTSTLSETDVAEKSRQRRKHCTESHKKRGYGFCPALEEGDKHVKRNRRARKAPALEESGNNLPEAEAHCEYNSREYSKDSLKWKRPKMLGPVNDRFGMALHYRNSICLRNHHCVMITSRNRLLLCWGQGYRFKGRCIHAIQWMWY